MTTTPLHQDPEAIAYAMRALEDMRHLSRSLTYAAVLTDDGFEVAHLHSPDIEAGRFASMSSSVQALSEAVTHEVRIGDAEYVVIGSHLGHVIQLRVPGHTAILAALFRTEETLGKALWVTRTTADALAHRVVETV